ncbi:uncharacterized protein DS421_8g225820 [Arachis hypogaea]|nr:uncharacterized protein DS421_8g225820 [Arachis hypogaea]
MLMPFAFSWFKHEDMLGLSVGRLINPICRVYLVLILGDFVTFHPHLFNKIAWFCIFSFNCA